MERKRKGRIVKVQNTNTRESDVDYSLGERSPYWDFLDLSANKIGERSDNGTREMREPDLANPDFLLSEEDSVTGESTNPEDMLLRKERIQNLERVLIKHLSDREFKVVHSLADGLTQQQVARKLRISIKSVESYLRRARKKIEKVASKTGLISPY